MVKDHSDSERGNPLLPHGLRFPIAAMVLLYAPFHHSTHSTYHGLTSVVEHWREREIAYVSTQEKERQTETPIEKEKQKGERKEKGKKGERREGVERKGVCVWKINV